MANAYKPIKATFLNEGEITIDNKDSGGLTYLGLAHNAWPTFEEWPTIINVCKNVLGKNGIKVSEQDLKNLGTSKGKDILINNSIKNEINLALKKKNLEPKIINFYKKEFWDTIKGDEIVSQSFAESLFDFGVNVYWKTAAKILQKLINVAIDGNIGEMTIYKLNCELIENHHEIHTQFAYTKIQRYVSICSNPKNSNKLKYFHGWLNRTFHIYQSNYTLDDIRNLISKTSEDGLRGPKGLRGYKTFLNSEDHYEKLIKLLKIYEINEQYSKGRVSIEDLLNTINVIMKEI